MEEPVCGGDASACHCHTAWAGMLGAPLIRDEVLQGREPWEKRLLAPWRMLHPLHRQPLPLAGVMRWIASGAGCGPRRGGQARSPARVLLLPPAAAPGAMGRPRRGGDGGGTGASPLAPRNHPPALALARPGPQGVTLHASRLAQRSRERRALPRECMERRAEAGAPARAWTERPQTLGGAGQARAPAPVAPLRRLVLGGRAWQRALGLGPGRGTRLLRSAERPEHAATDAGRQVHLFRQTAAGFGIGQERGGQGPAPPAQHGAPTLWPSRPDETLARQGRERMEHRAPRPPAAAMGGSQDSTGHLRPPRTRAPNAVRQDGAHRPTRGARAAPEGEPAPPDPGRRAVAGAPPAAATGRLVGTRTAEGEEESAHAGPTGLASATPRNVRRVGSHIDRAGAVFAGLVGGWAQVSPPGHQVSSAEETR
jgi:hypothetical protein